MFTVEYYIFQKYESEKVSNVFFNHNDEPTFHEEEKKKHCQDLMHDVKRINKQFTAY